MIDKQAYQVFLITKIGDLMRNLMGCVILGLTITTTHSFSLIHAGLCLEKT